MAVMCIIQELFLENVPYPGIERASVSPNQQRPPTNEQGRVVTLHGYSSVPTHLRLQRTYLHISPAQPASKSHRTPPHRHTSTTPPLSLTINFSKRPP